MEHLFSAHKSPADIRPQTAWVVFSGHTDLPWLRLLKPGFRHCFVILYDGVQWLSFDPLSHYTELGVWNLPDGFDLPGWLSGQGYQVVSAPVQRRLKRPAPWAFFTCVEAVKRVLGLHRRLIITPWQLFKFLNSQKGELYHG